MSSARHLWLMTFLFASCVVDRSGLAGRAQDAGADTGILRADADVAHDVGVVDSDVLDSSTDAIVHDGGSDAAADAHIDGGSDAGSPTEARCRARFDDAPGFLLCEHAETTCELYVRFSPPDVNCSSVCSRRDMSCVGSYDNARPDDCTRGDPVDCGGAPQDRICICSSTDDDDDED